MPAGPSGFGHVCRSCRVERLRLKPDAMLLQPRSFVLTPKRAAPVPSLCLAAARRQVTVQAIRPSNGNNNLLGPAATDFEARLQGASRQAMSRLNRVEARLDDLALYLDTLAAQQFNIITTSFIALSLAAATARVLGNSLPVDLVWPFMVLAAVLPVYYRPWEYVDSAGYDASKDLETARAEALADLESCRSWAKVGLAKARLQAWLLSSLQPAGNRVQWGQDLTGEQVTAAVGELEERVEQREEVLQSRLDKLCVRNTMLPVRYLGTMPLLITAPLPAHVFAGCGPPLEDSTPLFILCYLLACYLPWILSWRESRE